MKKLATNIKNIIAYSIIYIFTTCVLLVMLGLNIIKTASGRELSFSEIMTWPNITATILALCIIAIVHYVGVNAYKEGKKLDKKNIKENDNKI